jgi:hypothetical protein
MPGRKPPVKRGGAARGGRGGGRGGRGGAARGGAVAARSDRVAKPACRELPEVLTCMPSMAPLPEIFSFAFPEFSKQQCFFSTLERICPELGGSVFGHSNCWMGMAAGSIKNVDRGEEPGFFAALETEEGTRPIFVKRIHLLDPLTAIEGKYVMPDDGALPAPSDPWREALTKINDPLNEAYTDALFAMIANRLVQGGLSPHWCQAYGTFSARADRYLFNISEEYDSLRQKPWWHRNIRRGIFALHTSDSDDSGAQPRRTFEGGDMDLADDDFETMDGVVAETGDEAEVEETEDGDEGREEPEEAEPAAGLAMGNSIRLTTPKLRMKRIEDSPSASSSGSNSSSCEDSESELEDDVYAEFHNFPVQVTLLERADGTMDELLDAETGEDDMLATREDRWAAWIFQVIAALTTAQYYFGFVHNDLHTNNIMWSSTNKEHLYYRVHKGKTSSILKVPTYGRIMKIIDFGRASFHLPDPAGFFISDAFYPGNDAGSQYNCEPFYDPEEGEKVEPNPSFDLCRLAVSLLESLYPERPPAATPTRVMSREGAKLYTATTSEIYNMLWEWLQDDDGKNVLRLPNGEERYPDFDLYKAIAGEVHRAVPARQIERPLFAKYRCADSPSIETVYDLYI